jgi:flagellar biosynthesis anti-sigma factor FlgM
MLLEGALRLHVLLGFNQSPFASLGSEGNPWPPDARPKDLAMLDRITDTGRLGIERAQAVQPVAAPKAAHEVRGASTSTKSLAYEMLLAVAAPVDVQKLATIRQEIAEGRYRVDPPKIAARMVALDLPVKPDAKLAASEHPNRIKDASPSPDQTRTDEPKQSTDVNPDA